MLTFVFKKVAMFLAFALDLFRVITNKIEHCIDVFIPMKMKENSISIVFKQILDQRGIEENKECSSKCSFMHGHIFFGNFRLITSYPFCTLGLIFSDIEGLRIIED